MCAANGDADAPRAPLPSITLAAFRDASATGDASIAFAVNPNPSAFFPAVTSARSLENARRRSVASLTGTQVSSLAVTCLPWIDLTTTLPSFG